MTVYRHTAQVPLLVQEARALAERLQFVLSSQLEVGRLLHVLTAHQQHGVVGEIGTGCGVGAAWIATALSSHASLTTVELDEDRAAAARDVLAPVPNVRVLAGDWRRILPYGPFTLLFVDAPPKREEPDAVLQAVHPGGLIMLDDLTPEDQWSDEWRGKPDPVREFWLNDPRITATEVQVSPSMALILATRVE